LKTETKNIHQNLIDACRNNDRAAQYELYQCYKNAMYNTALRICGNVADAEDALQEAFVSAFKNMHQYREEASFGSWLKRIVVNKSLNLLRSAQSVAFEELRVADEKRESNPSFSEEVSMQWEIDQVKEAIMQLPVGFRSVLTLYLLEGYDHQEISEILGISVSTSKSQYKRAKDKIKDQLKQRINYG
jgi:RNA polymerase sigma-70 factor (ECF subfamily)